jgi:methylated-DNA-[protein]-cysteine S-methyltransferase
MIALLIPSHRAVSNDNMIENYNGGIEKKEFLLKLEKNDK